MHLKIYAIVCVVLFVVLLSTVLIYKKFNPKAHLSPWERYLDEPQLKCVREIERMHRENEEKAYIANEKEIYERITGFSANDEGWLINMLGLREWRDADINSDLYKCGKYLDYLLHDLSARYMCSNYAFQTMSSEDVLNEYGLNIRDDEILIHKLDNLVDVFEEKTRVHKVSYLGISTTFRSGSINYKMGDLTIIPKREQYWNHLDRGSIFMLNTKLVFVGEEKKINKVIKYDDILTGEIFENGVVLSLSNSKKVLLDFPQFEDKLLINDDRNQFIRVMKRIMEKTTDKHLVQLDKS